MNLSQSAPFVVNGWALFAHPLFLAELEAITRQVERLRHKDPTRSEYRQGNTLGDDHKHWLRAKFFQQYRLFFRYHEASKIIVYAWVNGENTKRAYESKDDAYRVFSKMLKQGHPPDDWETLIKAAKNLSLKLGVMK